MLGASRWRTFVRVTLPLAKEGILAGAVLSFAHTLGEFGVVLMVGGNLPGVTRTFPSPSTTRCRRSSTRPRTRPRCCCSSSRFSSSRAYTPCSGGPGRPCE